MSLRLFGLVCAAAILSIFSSHASAAVTATFENFSEGPVGSSFTDGLSGFVFSNGSSAGSGGGTFDIDSTTISYPSKLPGNIMSVNGYGPGAGLGLPAGPAFTVTFPTLTNAASLDIVYAAAFGDSVTLTGLTSTGQSVGQQVLALPGPGSPEVKNGLGIDSITVGWGTPFQKLTVSTSSGVGAGFDNISIPEPVSGALLGAGSVLLVGRRREKRNA